VVVKINIVVFRTVTPYRCLNPEAGGSRLRDKAENDLSETTRCIMRKVRFLVNVK